MDKYVQICTNMYKYVQIFTNMYEINSVWMYPSIQYFTELQIWILANRNEGIAVTYCPENFQNNVEFQFSNLACKVNFRECK